MVSQATPIPHHKLVRVISLSYYAHVSQFRQEHSIRKAVKSAKEDI